MARNKKRRRPIALRQERNAIRGALGNEAQDFTRIVVSQFGRLSSREAASLMSWIARYPAQKRTLSPPSLIRRYADLRPRQSLNSREVAIELLWTSQHLERNNRILLSYVECISALETAWAAKSAPDIKQVLNDIEKKCGYSAWLIGAWIAYLQQFEGLEAQKAYASAVHEAAEFSFAGYLAHFISQRNELPVTIARLQQTLSHGVEDPRADPGIATFVSVFVGGAPLPSSAIGLTDYLSVATSLSVVDAYEALVAVVAGLWGSDTVSVLPDATLRLLVPLAGHDYRAAKILAVITKDFTGLSFDTCEAEAAYFRGDLQNAERLAIERLRQNAFDVDAISVLANILARTDGDVPALPAISIDLVRLFRELKQRGRVHDRAAADAVKLITNLQHLPVAAALSALVAAEISSTPIYGHSALCRRFLAVRRTSAIHAIFLEKSAAYSLLEKAPHNVESDFIGKVAKSFFEDGDLSTECGCFDVTWEWSAFAALNRKDHAQALKFAQKLRASPTVVAKRLGVIVELHALAALDRCDDAIIRLGHEAATDPDGANGMPADLILANKRWREVKHLRGELSLSIALDIAAQRQADPATIRNRRFAYDEFLRAHDISRPSALGAVASRFDRASLVYYLRYLCVPSIMDVSFQTFKTSRALEDERIEVCNLLSELDAEHSDVYADEIKNITRRISIQDGLRDVDQSRLYVNTEALQAWGAREVAESFERYKVLLKAGIGFVAAPDYDAVVNNILSGDGKAYSDYLKYPKDEADNLLAEMTKLIRTQYLLSPDYGLDAYLSMRIRHGSLSGHLRGPLEERGLVLVRDSNTGTYNDLPESSDDGPESSILRLDKDDEDWAVLSACLKVFSAQIDDIIDDLIKTRLQVRTHEKPNGMFGQENVPIMHLFLRSGVREDTTLPEFLSLMNTVADILLQRDLAEVRKHINEDVKERLEQAISELRVALSHSVTPYCYSHVSGEIANSVPELFTALSRITEWFRPSQTQQASSLRSFDEIVEIGVAATKNARRGFEPVIEREIVDLGPMIGDVMLLFSDLLFTILDNVYRHSGLGNTPGVRIALSEEDESADVHSVVVLRVESAVASNVRNEQTLQRLDRIRNLIESGTYRTLVTREGGTGLIKLQRLISDNPRNSVKFGFLSDECFFVEVRVRLVFLSEAQSESLGLT